MLVKIISTAITTLLNHFSSLASARHINAGGVLFGLTIEGNQAFREQSLVQVNVSDKFKVLDFILCRFFSSKTNTVTRDRWIADRRPDSSLIVK